MPHGLRAAPPDVPAARRALGGPPPPAPSAAQPQTAVLELLGQPRVRASSTPAAATAAIAATSSARSPPGDGPRTTSPMLGLIAASTGTIVAVAAHARTSHGLTTTTRSAVSKAISAASVNRRGRSHTTVAPPRRPASMTACTAPASNSHPRRVPDSMLIPRCRGNASRTADQFSRPPCSARSGQRTPGVVSAPTSRSIPPAQGSRSTSKRIGRRLRQATANSDAPAPPRPPITATTAPRAPSSRADSPASASSRTRSCSCAGSFSTCPAPTSMAAAQVAGAGSPPVTTITCARRGNPVTAHPCAAASSSTTAAAADQAFLLTGNALPAWTTRTPTAAATRSSSSRSAGSASTARMPRASVIVIGPPCRGGGTRRQSRQQNLWTTVGSVDNRPTTAELRIYPRKGTTPARGGGGEGRRVSAPGGRADTPSAKPSDPYYTHDSVTQRKGCLREINTNFK